jgi:IMP dehydrogenase/GMP reductase
MAWSFKDFLKFLGFKPKEEVVEVEVVLEEKHQSCYVTEPPKEVWGMGLAFTFDDVLLLPQYSEVTSRKNVDISTTLLGFNFLNPIISANMDTVTGTEMAIAMHNSGGLGILHRYQTPEEVFKSIATLKSKGIVAIPSIGVGEEQAMLGVNYLVEQPKDSQWAAADAICIDIAHGDCKMMVDTIKKLLEYHPQAKIIAGNVATYEGARRLLEAGAIAIKVGIGPGCFTSENLVKTSDGLKQISDIKIGDKVQSHDGTFNRVINTIIQEKNEELIEINGIKCTKNHEFLVLDKKYQNIANEENLHELAEWVEARELNDNYLLIEML